MRVPLWAGAAVAAASWIVGVTAAGVVAGHVMGRMGMLRAVMLRALIGR